MPPCLTVFCFTVRGPIYGSGLMLMRLSDFCEHGRCLLGLCVYVADALCCDVCVHSGFVAGALSEHPACELVWPVPCRGLCGVPCGLDHFYEMRCVVCGCCLLFNCAGSVNVGYV